MCGICGHVDAAGADAETVEWMCAAIRHRGPDSRAVYRDGPVALGIQRLRVIDLATGDQPLFNEDRSLAVVFNGEIYNFRELRERLIQAGHRFSTRTDTEVIVHLYESDGDDCVHALEGMFAFAVWDLRRGRLLLARDRIGKKPLYYHHGPGRLAFASELPALLRDPAVPARLDHAAIDMYLAYGYVPDPFTPFADVRKLPPGSRLTFVGGRVAVERYWQLEYRRKVHFADDDERRAAIRDEIRRAVRRRLIADVPLGAFLSGGVDSSAVVAAMAEASSAPVKTFSIGFTSESFDELPHARRVAEHFGTDHHELVVHPDVSADLPAIARAYGEPFADHSAVPSYYLAQLARRHVTVALNGDGGDECFGGYRRYAAETLSAPLLRVPRQLRVVAGRLGRRLPVAADRKATSQRLRALLTTSAEPHPIGYARRYMSFLLRDERERLYTPAFRVSLPRLCDGCVVAPAWEAAAADTLVDRMLATDVATYLPGDLLVKMDIATMAYALEARSPLLDARLLEFAASLPSELKVRRGQLKVAYRDALRGWVPDSALDRRKQGFEPPVKSWLRTGLREFLRDVLFDSGSLAGRLFEPAAVRGLVDAHLGARRDNSRQLWALLMLELWYDSHGRERPA